MLEVLLAAYPTAITREQLGEASGCVEVIRAELATELDRAFAPGLAGLSNGGLPTV